MIMNFFTAYNTSDYEIVDELKVIYCLKINIIVDLNKVFDFMVFY